MGLGVAAVLALLALLLLAAPRPQPVVEAGSAEPTTSRRAFSQLIRTGGMWQAMLTSGMVLAALDLLLAFLPVWAAGARRIGHHRRLAAGGPGAGLAAVAGSASCG